MSWFSYFSYLGSCVDRGLNVGRVILLAGHWWVVVSRWLLLLTVRGIPHVAVWLVLQNYAQVHNDTEVITKLAQLICNMCAVI